MTHRVISQGGKLAAPRGGPGTVCSEDCRTRARPRSPTPEATDVKFRAAVVLAVLLASGRAEAQQVDDRARGAARTLAEDGVTALQNGDATSAVDKLERAYEIIHLPTVGLWSARALVKAG